MLILSRSRRQSVVVGDEITVTVESIMALEDRRGVGGATVQLGFQSPRYISIYRQELLARSRAGAHGRRAAPRRPPRAGQLVDLPGLTVRLRVQVPRKVPVSHNRTPVVGRDLEITGQDGRTAARTVYEITCQKDDHINICGNITIVALNFQRFVFASAEPVPVCASGA